MIIVGKDGQMPGRRCRAAIIARLLIATAAIVLSASRPAFSWPDQPVRIVTLAAPGGGSDAVARILAEALARRWQHPVVVDNRPGADGIVAVATFLGSRDGHTLLFAPTGTVTVNPLLHEHLPYDPVKDLVPISFAVEDFIAVVAAPSLAAGSLADLVTLAKAKPGELNYATVPGPPHLFFLAFQKSTGIEIAMIPYKNPVGAIPDLVNGSVQLGVMPLASVLAQARAGRIRLLGMASPRRAPAAPDIPTVGESGYPDLAFSGGLGLFGPRDMTPDLRDRIAADVRETVAVAEVAQRLADIGYVARGDGPVEFAAMLVQQSAKWAAVARAFGAKQSE